MKAAILSFEFPEYCARLATALTEHIEVLLCLPQQLASRHQNLVGNRVCLHEFHKPRLRQPLQQSRMIGGLFRTLRKFKPDVLHLQQGHFWFNLALPAFTSRLILTVHDPLYHAGDAASHKTPYFIMTFGYRQAREIIVHGEILKSLMIERCGVAAKKVHVIPHISLEEPKQEDPGEPEQKNRVLFFGRIWPYKGLDYLIRAEPFISRRIPGLQIIIAGEGENFSRYRRQMINPERFLVYDQFVSNELSSRLFKTSSVVVLPYIDASQSGVVSLACSAGKPVVATTVGSLPEAVEHGRTGLLVPPRNERALAEAIITLLENDDLRRQLGQNAKRKSQIDFAPAEIARRTLSVYERALDA
jgi:glycosyltransferase involved in cell wall biosynthesis